MAEKALSLLKKDPDGTLILNITIPKEEIAKVQEEVIKQIVDSSNLPGFRKGKAPREMVEKATNSERVNEEILKRVLPDSYIKAVQEHKLHPIINPKIHVDSVVPGEDWSYTARTCEVPEIALKDYKKAISKVTAKSKIILPGNDKPQEANFDEIMKALTETVEVKVPQILVEQEVDRLLSQMLEEIQKLGLTLDQYLASTKKTPDELRADYGKKAENDIKIEFALQKIADSEKITAEEKEIEEAIQKATSPDEKQHLESNKYLLSSIIRQQKTLDFLKTL